MKMNLTSGVRLSFAASALVCLVPFTASAKPLRIVLPTETASFRTTQGAELAMAHCLQCHSAEYVTTQPPLAREAWLASIEKMRKKYGAAVPTEAEAPLLDYLVATYGKPATAPKQK
jgi:mono/diheme cytochrome c family protein